MNPEHIKIIRDKMNKYFDSVAPEQLEKDLAAADFDHYNSIEDSPIVYSPEKEKH